MFPPFLHFCLRCTLLLRLFSGGREAAHTAYPRPSGFPPFSDETGERPFFLQSEKTQPQ